MLGRDSAAHEGDRRTPNRIERRQPRAGRLRSQDGEEFRIASIIGGMGSSGVTHDGIIARRVVDHSPEREPRDGFGGAGRTGKGYALDGRGTDRAQSHASGFARRILEPAFGSITSNGPSIGAAIRGLARTPTRTRFDGAP
jgi:hypothetical protein